MATSSSSLGASFSEVEGERYPQLRALVVSCVPFFSEVEPSEEGLHIKMLQGGITNQLYKITAPSLLTAATSSSSKTSSGCTHSVVVRIFGKETDKIISRDAEQFWQSKFLKTFGKYESALVYEYLDGFRPLDYPEMSIPKYAQPIARELARFHDHAARVSTFSTSQHGPNFLQVFATKWVPMVLDRADVSKRVVDGKGDTEGFESYSSLHWSDTVPMGSSVVTVLERELIELGQVLALLQAKGELPTGICHNDLLSGNIMVRDGAEGEGGVPDVKLIDFEYAQSCYTYYDIANHLCEWAGFDCEYEKFFPTKDAVKLFLKDYFGEGARLVSGGANGGGNIDAAISEKELDRAADIVLFFSLYSHLVWAVWAVIQGMYSVIDFPYLPYSTLRWGQYLRTKEQFINPLLPTE